MCVESRDSNHISFADNLAFHAVLSVSLLFNVEVGTISTTPISGGV